MKDCWGEDDIKKPQQIVVCAACKLDGIIFAGARHFDQVMIQQIKAVNDNDRWWSTEEQGFIDQLGNFLTREEAMIIVKESGQSFDEERNGGSRKRLFSEGLY